MSLSLLFIVVVVVRGKKLTMDWETSRMSTSFGPSNVGSWYVSINEEMICALASCCAGFSSKDSFEVDDGALVARPALTVEEDVVDDDDAAVERDLNENFDLGVNSDFLVFNWSVNCLSC